MSYANVFKVFNGEVVFLETTSPFEITARLKVREKIADAFKHLFKYKEVRSCSKAIVVNKLFLSQSNQRFVLFDPVRMQR